MPRQSVPLHERYRKLPEAEGSCWLWLDCTSTNGYGMYKPYQGQKPSRAHRAVYEDLKGKISAECELHHTCLNRRCVNPAHLEVVTVVEHRRKRSDIKLSMEKATEIRSKAKAGTSQRGLAHYYGVSIGTISNILTNRIYREVSQN